MFGCLLDSCDSGAGLVGESAPVNKAMHWPGLNYNWDRTVCDAARVDAGYCFDVSAIALIRAL